MAVQRAAIISYRLGGADGVSIEAAKWAAALERLGLAVDLVAGEPADGVTVVTGIGISEDGPVDMDQLERALGAADVVIVENLCSLPLNPMAGKAVASVLHGRPAVLRHHDLAWHRRDTKALGGPPDDPAWRHVTINHLFAEELAQHGIEATVLYNRFDMDPPPGRRAATRQLIGVGEGQLLAVQPTRALPRKNVPGGLALAEALSATYWLTAAAEDGYGDELATILQSAHASVIRGQGPGTMDDVYAAADFVVLPSIWEGFGNPVIESVTHHRPLALGDYPVAAEIRAMGFEFFSSTDPATLRRFLEAPDDDLLERNHVRARARFDLADLPAEIDQVLDLVVPDRARPEGGR